MARVMFLFTSVLENRKYITENKIGSDTTRSCLVMFIINLQIKKTTYIKLRAIESKAFTCIYNIHVNNNMFRALFT